MTKTPIVDAVKATHEDLTEYWRYKLPTQLKDSYDFNAAFVDKGIDSHGKFWFDVHCSSCLLITEPEAVEVVA